MILNISSVPHCIDSGSMTQHLWGAFFCAHFYKEKEKKIMKTIKGIYAGAKIFTDDVEDYALA